MTVDPWFSASDPNPLPDTRPPALTPPDLAPLVVEPPAPAHTERSRRDRQSLQRLFWGLLVFGLGLGLLLAGGLVWLLHQFNLINPTGPLESPPPAIERLS